MPHQLLQTVKKHKKLVAILAVATVIGFPLGVQALEQTPEEPTEQVVVEEQPVEETPVEETPVEETPVEEIPVEEIPVEEVPAEEIGTPVTLGQALVIAEAEHPESDVVKAKAKQYQGQAVFAFHFADSWKVVVQASDGAVVKVVDAGNKDHNHENKYFKHFRSDSDESTTEGDTESSSSDRRWGHWNSRHHDGDDRR